MPEPILTPSSLIDAAALASPTGATPGEAVSAVVLVERLEAYARRAAGAYAQNTVRAIRADLRVWQAWCATVDAPTIPADPTHVAAFVDTMAEFRAPATIRRYLASLAFVHRAAELPDPTRAEVVRLAVRRMARAKGTRQRQAAPLTERHVQRIVGNADSDTLIDCRDRALLLVASDLLARASELVALEVHDIGRAADGSGTALIRRSKTDQEGQGSVGYLSPEAMTALRAWCTRAELTDGPLFRAVSRHGRIGGALHPDMVARLFRKLAVRVRLDPSGVSGHSCRVGTAQDLVAAGVDLSAVMQAGRWKTPTMPARYAEHLLPARGAVAQLRERRRRG
jgi:site-specific recombinase XerD